MPQPRSGLRPGVETLDPRLVLSVSHSSAYIDHSEAAPTPAARTSTPADLRAYADAYLSTRDGPRYNPASDSDGDGRIGRDDATPILRRLATSTTRVPFQVRIALAPGEQVPGHHPANNGGVTRRALVTVVGRTTPNSIIFTDPIRARPGRTLISFEFRGTPLVSDARGHFSFPVQLADLADGGGSLTGTSYLVRDPFGRSMIRAFPILRIR